jgi:hypothetical protein
MSQGYSAMTQLVPNSSGYDSASSPIPLGQLNPKSAELNLLLLRCSELSREITELRRLVKGLEKNSDSDGVQKILGQKRDSAPVSRLRRHRRNSVTTDRRTGPVRSELARACRIALMETDEAAAVETIYDRIQRRGSFSFAGYKRPFRAIMLAMSAMVRRDEASILSEAGHRRWLSKLPRVPFEHPISLTLT